MIQKPNNPLRFLSNFLIAAFSASVPKTTGAPIDFALVRITQMNRMIQEGAVNQPYKGIFDCIKRVAMEQGITTLFKGNGKNLLRYVPNQGLIFSFRGLYQEISQNKFVNQGFLSSMAKNFFIGGLSGISALTFIYPIDHASTKLMEQKVNMYRKKKEIPYTGILDFYKRTLTSEGIQGIYKGFGISSFGVFVYRSIYFGLFDTAKLVLPQKFKESLLVDFSLGWSSCFLAFWASSPIDIVRRRLIFEPKRYTGFLDCVRKLYEAEGAITFFRNTSTIRAVSGSVMLAIYEKLQRVVYKKQEEILF